MRIWRTLLGVAWVGVVAWVAGTRYDVLVAGHPAYLVALAAGALVGIGLLLTAWLAAPASDRHRALRLVGSLLAAVLTALGVGLLAWLRPFPADQVALDAMSSTREVRVSSSATRITLTPIADPSGRGPRVGLVFQPGARVDARAYVALLRRVSAQGILVVVVKQPMGIGSTATDAPAEVIEDHPEVRRWYVGGHSLGGVVASGFATDNTEDVSGLLLWASYPRDPVPSAVAVTSIFGTEDALTTPRDVEESRAQLPEATRYVAVEGAVHAFFGDYGEQPGDGEPTVSREAAQDQVLVATVTALRARPRASRAAAVAG